MEGDGASAGWEITLSDGVEVAVPILPAGLGEDGRNALQVKLLHQLLAGETPAVAWYYTPMALGYARQIQAGVTIYDNMDELSLFHGADSRMLLLEKELMARADLMFSGGRSLFEAKAHLHRNIHCVPSSVDVAHFQKARGSVAEPADQAVITGTRLGFFGVIDERMDMALLDGVALLRPDIQFIMLGPVVKIDPASRPDRPNIHWLGGKRYAELPAYLAHWAGGIMPFALNDATRFISPTKTPEYLAAGLPVVSTPIRDVVHPYGDLGLVEIAHSPAAFAGAIDRALAAAATPGWKDAVHQQLAATSWDRTWATMVREINAVQGNAARKECAHA